MLIKGLVGCALFALVLFSSAAAAEEITLKLSLTSSDRAESYEHVIKPFVEAVNTEAEGLIKIEVYFSNSLGGTVFTLPQLVLNGVADIALIVPGLLPLRFPDADVLELPGLFQDALEATLTYAALTRAHALRGYEDFFVIGAFSPGPGHIHSRKRLTSLSDLKGMRISTSTTIAGTTLERLGAVTNVRPISQVLDAMSAGSIDGAALPTGALFIFGIGRLTTYHYLLPIGGNQLALVMNRKKFDGLPEQAQNVIRKYSDEWIVARFTARRQVLQKEELELLKSNDRRTVTSPSRMDIEKAQAAFQSVKEDWVAKSQHNTELLTMVEKELAKIRSTP
jgi:TRAP-type C4-dicarboxylate transport system substrate-binding protein